MRMSKEKKTKFYALHYFTIRTELLPYKGDREYHGNTDKIGFHLLHVLQKIVRIAVGTRLQISDLSDTLLPYVILETYDDTRKIPWE